MLVAEAMMTSRDAEEMLLDRCAKVGSGAGEGAQNQMEANVFRVASMVVVSNFPLASNRLLQASADYFATRPLEELAAVETVKRGWVDNLPRLRDMLSRRLPHEPRPSVY
jgi:hypothetical protein